MKWAQNIPKSPKAAVILTDTEPETSNGNPEPEASDGNPEPGKGDNNPSILEDNSTSDAGSPLSSQERPSVNFSGENEEDRFQTVQRKRTKARTLPHWQWLVYSYYSHY